MSAELELHRTIVEKLRANGPLTLLLSAHDYKPATSAVYDYVAQPAKPEDEAPFPYVVVGDTTAAQWDADDFDGQEHTLTLHIWDRYRGSKRVREIQSAIYSALHRAALVVSGQHVIFCYFEFSATINDPDVRTEHGVVRYRVITQELVP